MHLHMDDNKLGTISQVKAFLSSVEKAVTFSLETKGYANKQKMYTWIANTLTRLRYKGSKKKDRGIIISYIVAVTQLSRASVKRLAQRKSEVKSLTVIQSGRHSFPRKYTTSDIARLIETDNAHGRISGDATKKILQREYDVYDNKKFATISHISVSHLYNLRSRSKQYESQVLFLEKTKSTQVAIGRRAKPISGDKPGFLRVDSVHQGDLDKQKGVYHVNLVDEVTQWEILLCVEGISEHFLLPALEVALALFPFRILGFHSDNGSEYINMNTASLLQRLFIDQTKSRSRRTNDNALAEGKNASRIRKHMGHSYIHKKYARTINAFYRAHMDDYLNYHRPCAFATEFVNKKGKITKKYDTFLTPFEKLTSIKNYEQFLKDGVASASLAEKAAEESDNESATRMQEAKKKLFKTFTR
jgi:hypothetical protein